LNIVDRTYLEILDEILLSGTRETNRTGTDTISLFGVSYRLPVSASAFPILTHKKIQWRSLVAEIIWYLSGEPHIRNLQKYTKIWSAWADDNGNLETAYGRFWRHYPLGSSGGDDPLLGREAVQSDCLNYLPQTSFRCFDQLKWVVEELKRNPRSRRLHITAWYPPNATASKLPPCHHSFTLNYQAGKLNLHLQQRSSDHCVGNPFNLTCYSLLLLLICREVALEPGDFYHSITDAHVYVDHIEPYSLASRTAYDLPQLDLSGLGDRSMFDLDYDLIDKFVLVNYDHGPAIKLPVAV
jgi:thymidylate synthase